MNMKEVFKKVIFRNEVSDVYEVSNLGRVRSVDRYNHSTGRNQSGSYETAQFIKGRFLKPMKDRGGYLYVNLAYKGKYKSVKIHRLVATSFIDNPNNLPAVNHIDEDKTNNKVSNLEWVTIKENNKYGSRRTKFNPIDIYDQSGHLYMHFDSLREASSSLGIDRKTIKKMCNYGTEGFRVGSKPYFYRKYTFVSARDKNPSTPC